MKDAPWTVCAWWTYCWCCCLKVARPSLVQGWGVWGRGPSSRDSDAWIVRERSLIDSSSTASAARTRTLSLRPLTPV
ncbi:unnamed protein product, partial [Timema podura]|nr:unnamed protein product [Timema podura]